MPNSIWGFHVEQLVGCPLSNAGRPLLGPWRKQPELPRDRCGTKPCQCLMRQLIERHASFLGLIYVLCYGKCG